MSKTKIAVTGASGFIGVNLIPKLYAAGCEVIALNSQNGDVTDSATWQKLPKVDVVIHLAAKSFVPRSWEDSQGFIQCNLMGTVGALNYCKTHNARLIFISSYLYGNPDQLPIREDAPIRLTNPYALSKKLAEDTCTFFSKSESIPVTILRPFNVFGPGQPENFLIQTVISQLKSKEVIKVKDLEPKRDYVFIDDVSDAIVKSIKLESSFAIINIGSGMSYSVAEIIEMIQELSQTSIPVESTGQRRQGEIMDTVADIHMAKSLLGWTPATSMKEGLLKIIESMNH